MYQNVELFQTAGAMARHAGSRQAVVAQNIANAEAQKLPHLSKPASRTQSQNQRQTAIRCRWKMKCYGLWMCHANIRAPWPFTNMA